MTPSKYRKINRKEAKDRLVASKDELEGIGEKRKKYVLNK